ncbi:hypothetical protein CHUAL_013993 [Chamberlinius hualienensis]
MFGLFEAMSAIEMMDPKMDAGMMCNRGSKRSLNFYQSVMAGKLKLVDFTADEQIGIIDATLACLVTWLEGHSLAQTVLTNLYLHEPYLIEDKCIKAFSICTLKLVELIRTFVSSAAVFEEEDFQPVVYGYQLANDVFDAKAAGMMKEVEDELQRKVKNTRSKHGEDWDPETQQQQHKEATALYARIKFCRLFYLSLLAFSKKEAFRIEDAQKFLVTLAELVPQIQSSIDLGLQPEPQPDCNARAADYPFIMGFEPLVNQRLLPPTFPRYIKIKTRQEAAAYFEGLINRLKIICNVVNCQTYHVSLNFFIEFSKLGPCVLSRSIAQLLYLPQPKLVFGIHSISDVLRDAARLFIAPPALASRSASLTNVAKDCVELFLSHCVRPFSNLIQICGHNRARQRDKLAHILEDFANLQDEADKVDSFLHSLYQKMDSPSQHLACFGTWILYHTLRIMILYVLSGFELELYSTYEYHYVFWYLFEFLYGWMVSALSRADGFLLEQESVSAEQQKGRNSKKTKKKKKVHPHGREITINQACHNLCGGFCNALAGFRVDGKMKKPNFHFDCEQIRYERRFAPFGGVMTPPPVQYIQYQEMNEALRYESKQSASDMYLAACKFFHQAKTLFENVANPSDEITALIKVSKTNFVVMKLLAGGHKKDSSDPPEFDFNLHKTFPVIRIV